MCKTFTEQLKEVGKTAEVLGSLAVIAGYAHGTCKAHYRPTLSAIRAKLAELAPKSLLMAAHAYHEGKAIGFSEESGRMCKRAAAKAARTGKAALA